MRGLVLAALVVGSSVCWAAELCKGNYGPDTAIIGIDSGENPLKSVAVTFRRDTFAYRLEQISSNKVYESYNLYTKSGELAGFTKKGNRRIAELRYYRKKGSVLLMDLWADGGVRAICQKVVKKD